MHIDELAHVEVVFDSEYNMSTYIVPRAELEQFFVDMLKTHFDPATKVDSSTVVRIHAFTMALVKVGWGTAHAATPAVLLKKWTYGEAMARLATMEKGDLDIPLHMTKGA